MIFSIIQILLKINFEVSRSAKSAVFAILGAVNLVHLVNSAFKKDKKSKFRASKCVKMAELGL